MTDLKGKTVLITGANTGIGKATAHELAGRGARLVLANRSEAKTTPVIEEIARATGNNRVEYLHLDLADLDSVRASAAAFLSRDEPLHILVNNAGIGGQRGMTKQGFEMHFGVNHLGHFLFTTLLLDRLRANPPARVVNVSSTAHFQAKGLDFDKVREPTSISGLPEYGVSKLCNVLFTQELARRYPASEVAAFAVHPGTIASDIWRRIPWPIRPVILRFMKSTEEGAATSVYCATAPDAELTTGAYYDDCKEKAPNRIATPELAAELWSRSESWTAAT